MIYEDLKLCLEQVKIFHDRICPFLALGIRTSKIAMKEMGINRIMSEESIGEDFLAIMECNNCFDGVQIAMGCTFGNNSLIYHDLGKNALTILRRVTGMEQECTLTTKKLERRIFRKSLYTYLRKSLFVEMGVKKIDVGYQKFGMGSDIFSRVFVAYRVESLQWRQE